MERHATAAFCRISRCVGHWNPPIILDLALREEITLLVCDRLPPAREEPCPPSDSAFVGFSGDGTDGVYRAGVVDIGVNVGVVDDLEDMVRSGSGSG